MTYCNTKDKELSRFKAVMEVKNGRTVAQVARRFGCFRSTVYYWLRRYEQLRQEAILTGEVVSSIPTISSRPKNSPRRIPMRVERAILEARQTTNRCAEVIQAELFRKGYNVSSSTIGRVISRYNLSNNKKKQRKRRGNRNPRPHVKSPGDLVEVDTVFFRDPITLKYRYVTSVIDVCSRMGYAYVHESNNPYNSFIAVLMARQYFPFEIKLIQTDNGQEFQSGFRDELTRIGIKYRHTRVRRPNDNAHVERFNRTLREECLGFYIPKDKPLATVQKRIDNWIHYYNYERANMGIKMLYPATIALSLM